MSAQDYLTNQLIIAMPNLNDPHFSGTVTYICEHSKEGAMGIVINRPLSISLGDIFEQMEITSDNYATNQLPVLAGGPVGLEQGFILHDDDSIWQSTIKMTNNIAVTSSKDILHAIANGDGPKNYIMSLGYAGWDAGQLEEEMTTNYWLHSPADNTIIFEQPFVDRYSAAITKIGFDIAMLSTEPGHC